MAKITRFWRQLEGQPLKTKDLALWRQIRIVGAVQKISAAPQGQSRSKVNSWIQAVTLGDGGELTRPSSQGQYQAIADSNRVNTGPRVARSTGIGQGCKRSIKAITQSQILPYTHSGCDCGNLPQRPLGRLLSGIALAWMAFRRVV